MAGVLPAVWWTRVLRPAHIFVVHMHNRSSSVLIVYAIISKKSIDYILFFYYYKKYFSTSSQCFNVYFFIYCLRCPRASCPSSANCSNTVKSKTSLIFTSSHIAIFSKNENTLFISSVLLFYSFARVFVQRPAAQFQNPASIPRIYACT